MTESSDRLWQRSPRVVERSAAGTTVLLSRDTSESMALSGRGALVWLALAHEATALDITEALTDVMEVTPAEVRTVLTKLESAGMVMCR